MSQGLGRIERAALDALVSRTLTVPGLAICLGWTEPTDAQLVSLRRAMRSLKRKGLIEAVDRVGRRDIFAAREGHIEPKQAK